MAAHNLAAEAGHTLLYETLLHRAQSDFILRYDPGATPLDLALVKDCKAEADLLEVDEPPEARLESGTIEALSEGIKKRKGEDD